MVVIVLTGGIGSGKGVAAQYFEGRGAAVIDLDVVAHEVMSPGSPVLASVAQAFGAHILRADGSLDRAALADVCFADKIAAARLDAIVHPVVEQRALGILDELRRSAVRPDVVVVEVPLLAEAPGMVRLGDMVVAISADEATRVERAVARGMGRADVERRVSVQADDAARSALADIVIENDDTLEAFAGALEAFWRDRLGSGVQGG